MVAVAEEVTAVVVRLKVAVVLPAATVTVAGTVAEVLLLDKVTEIPPVGAAALKVTVPVDELPPVTVVGLSDTDNKAAVGEMVSAAVLLTLR
jgi:hypothetical protein